MSAFWAGLATVMGVWTVAATFVNAKYAKPSAPKWKVIVYTVFVDVPAFYSAVGKTGLIGRVNLPGLPSMDHTPTEQK